MKYIITESQYKSIMSERFKVSKDERTIISDTENFLQIVPLTESASWILKSFYDEFGDRL